jgi:hypothetical protein
MEYAFKNSNTYRTTTPQGKCDLLIVSLVHQNPDMVRYMTQNIQKYVKGSFKWIAHYNGIDPVDENTLPEWAWLVRDTNVTQPYEYHRLRTFGIIKALSFAIQSGLQFTNVLTLTSGSAFFKEFQVPVKPRICLDSYEKIFDPDVKLYHSSPIDIKYSGKCAKYLESIGSPGWQYTNGDLDIEFQTAIQKRNFKFFKGGQWPGQMWPYEVAKMLYEDIAKFYDSPNTKKLNYACEEIYLSTYAYNYAIEYSIPIEFNEVITNWKSYYDGIKHIEYIDFLRKNPQFDSGHAVSKLSDNINDPVRKYIQDT